MNKRLREGIDFIAREFSVERRDLQRHFRGGADMLTTALLTGGYVVEKGGRMALSPKGIAVMRERRE